MIGAKDVIWKWIRRIIPIICIFILIIGSVLLKNKEASVTDEVYKLPIYSVDSEEKVIALTFDINWAETDYLKSILDTLDKYNVKATFFIMGRWANYSEENTEKLKMIYESGNEIGNHSYIHPDFKSISEERMIQELKRADDIIYEIIGEKPKLFRFPSGSYSEKAVEVVTKAGYMPIQWDVDSVDWKELGEDIEYKRVVDNVKPGSIVLFHNNCKYTPNNLDKIIKKLQDEGYTFMPVGDMVIKENFIIDEKGIQHRK